MEATESDLAIATPRVRLARQILLQGVLLGILADATLRRSGNGYGWTIWILAFVITAGVIAVSRGERLGWERLGWLAAAVGCATAFAWRDAEMMRVVNIAGTLVALTLASMVFAGSPASGILSARVRDVVAGWFFAARDALIGAIPLAFKDAEMQSTVSRSVSARVPAVRAILLALPVVLVFGSLLSSADPVFGAIFRLPSLDVETALSHAFLIGAFTWMSAGGLRGALLPGVRVTPRLELPFTLRAIDVGVPLGALIALFTLFVGLQARWLFGGSEVLVATTGLSVAEYARGGFFELVGVAALVLPLILVTGAIIGDDARAIRMHRQLSLVLVVLLGAIMASAVIRMRLYVTHYGLTTDRFHALVFMAWLGLVFAALGATVLRGWSRPFAAMAVISGFLMLGALNLVNPDVVVARTNLGRGDTRVGIDYRYLARLSGDAAPMVARALASAEPGSATCDAARAMLRRWSSIDAAASGANLGARRGRAAVLELVGPAEARLCGDAAKTE